MKKQLILAFQATCLLACSADPNEPLDGPVDVAHAALETFRFDGTLSSSGTSWRTHEFDASAGDELAATLNWDSSSADLNLFLYAPNGELVAYANRTTNRPERVRFTSNATGRWKLGIKAKTGSANYTLQVTVTPGASSCTVSSTLVPSCGAWWGMWTDTSRTGSGGTWSSRLSDLEDDLGRRFDIVHNYHQWTDTFPTSEEIARANSGQILLLGWKSPQSNGSWARIAQGREDSVIDAAASRIADLAPRKVMLTFHHEPEDEVGSRGTARDYVNAYRRIHDRFAAAGVTNVVWVWNVMGYSKWYSMYEDLYPGDAYVDWIAWDPYRFGVGTCGGNVNLNKTFAEFVDPFYDWLVDHGLGNKPFMLGEYGTRDERPEWGPSNAAFFRGIPETLRTTHPNLKALVYFNDRNGSNPACDSNLWDSSVTRAGFRDAGLELLEETSKL